MYVGRHIGSFNQLKLPFLKSTMIFCHHWMLAKSRSWLYLTFPLPLMPWTILFFDKTRWLVWGYWEGTRLVQNVSDWKDHWRIKLGGCLSSKTELPLGVIQGSVLPSLFCTLYTTPLTSMISRHAILHHLYADDSQLWPLHQTTLLQHWMVYNCVWLLSSDRCLWKTWN